jgi:hypothetical protein
MSLERIGFYTGITHNHASVKYGIEKIEGFLTYDREIIFLVKKLQSKIIMRTEGANSLFLELVDLIETSSKPQRLYDLLEIVSNLIFNRVDGDVVSVGKKDIIPDNYTRKKSSLNYG